MTSKRNEGSVVGYVPGQRTGRIKGTDGIQYSFDLADVDDTRLVSRIQSRRGQDLREPVEFVADGYRAKAIKPSGPGGLASAQRSPFSLRLPEDRTLRQAFGAVTAPRGAGVYHEAKAAVGSGNPDQAVPLFQEAIRQGYNTLSAVKDLASAYLMLEQSAEAIKLLKGFIASPDLPGDELIKFRNLLENAQAKALKERKNRKKAYHELNQNVLAGGGAEEPSRLASQLSKHLAALPPLSTYLRRDDDDDDVAVDELFGRHFLGTIEASPTETAAGKLRAYYELTRNVATGSWRLDDGDGFKDLGPSARAEWPAQDSPANIPVGTLVHFIIEGRTSSYGVISDTKPWYIAQPKLERLGALIIPTPEQFWTDSDRRVPYEDPDLTLYCASSGTLTGPWQVQPRGDGGVLVPCSPDGTVKEMLVEDLEPDLIVGIEGQEYLLPCSTIPVSRMVDVRASQELTDWLIATLTSLSSEVIERMDESHPRWRNDLEDSINTLSDPQERATFLARWQRVEPIVEALAHQNEIFRRLLNENPTLSALLKSNLRYALDQARSDIFRQAEAEAAQLLEHEQAQLHHLRGEIEELRRQADALKDRAVQQPPNPPKLQSLAAGGRGKTPAQRYIHQTLATAMQLRIAEVTVGDAATFHLAALVSRCLIVPSSAWSRAYFETFTLGSANYTAIAVPPTWLTFEDAWKAGFSTPWQQALENPDRLYLVHFAHFSNAMLGAWAPPLLLASAGLADALPGLSMAVWPDNLRTFWSPGSTPSLFPGSMGSIGAFSAVAPESSSQVDATVTQVDTATPISAELWRSWVPIQQAPRQPLSPKASELGEFARGATDDIARLIKAGESLVRQMTPELAERIRIQWPREVMRRLVGSRE